MASWKDYLNTGEQTSGDDNESQKNVLVEQYLFLRNKADTGEIAAINDLGLRLYMGYFDSLFYQGQPKKIAVPYLEIAAEHGSKQAQTCLGVIYETGGLGEKDLQKAELYYTLAARQNVGKAQYRLGVLRVQKGREDGLHWLCCAHLNGEKESTNILKWMIQRDDDPSRMRDIIDWQIKQIKSNGIIPE